jgi:hypothetical protein
MSEQVEIFIKFSAPGMRGKTRKCDLPTGFEHFFYFSIRCNENMQQKLLKLLERFPL